MSFKLIAPRRSVRNQRNQAPRKRSDTKPWSPRIGATSPLPQGIVTVRSWARSIVGNPDTGNALVSST